MKYLEIELPFFEFLCEIPFPVVLKPPSVL
jgi:hypothetical protein